MVEGRYRMIQGSEDAVLWLQLSEALTAGMLGDLRGKKRRTGKYSQDRKEGAWRALYLPAWIAPIIFLVISHLLHYLSHY